MSMTNQPTKAHLWLADAVGTWHVEGRYYVAPDEEPMEASGSEVVEMFGAFWRRSHLEMELPGSIVRGCTCLGFEPLRQRFVATWLDTTNPFLYVYEGSLDEASGTLTLTGTNTDPASGQRALYRSVERFALPSRRTLELFVQPPGRPELRILTYELQRRG